MKIYQTKNNNNNNNRIIQKNFKKNMAFKGVVSKESAMPPSQKVAILVEEGLRMIRNNSPVIVSTEVKQIINIST